MDPCLQNQMLSGIMSGELLCMTIPIALTLYVAAIAFSVGEVGAWLPWLAAADAPGNSLARSSVVALVGGLGACVDRRTPPRCKSC